MIIPCSVPTRRPAAHTSRPHHHQTTPLSGSNTVHPPGKLNPQWNPLPLKNLQGAILNTQCRESSLADSAVISPLHPCTHAPWQMLAFDVMGLLPTHHGYHYILTFVDTYSRIVIARPINNHTTYTVVQMLLTSSLIMDHWLYTPTTHQNLLARHGRSLRSCAESC